MNQQEIKKTLRLHFPIFKQEELVDEISSKGIYMYVPSHQHILEVGSFISVVPLVIKGSIKVVRQEKNGKLLLYYIKAGESCAMTLSSCMRKEKSKIKAIVQEDTNMVALPVEVVYYLYRKFPAWQDFVIETFNRRFIEVMTILDDVVFHKMDERLAKYLLNRSCRLSTKDLKISHKEIADDLATSREVISRLLKQMEQVEKVELSRGKIKLLNISPNLIT